MNCIIIEDQLPAQRILKKYIADTSTLTLVGAYTDALQAIDVLKSKTIDIIFLDIHLPKLSGMDFLKSLSNPPKVILTTAFQDYALESYEYNVVDYLLKPFSFQRFVKAISKVKNDKIDNENSTSLEEIYIKSGYDHIRVKTNEILFIKADSDYTEIHLKNKKHLSSESLRYWEEFLSKKMFLRLHKSYIINTKKIKKVSGNQVFIENNVVIPIGRAYKNEFTKQLIK
ncbi:response regulator transcription factor [uncultured Winogradskyella sp.]|uniref:LytR/AlgR family response regulator transcription factor n=1 Tax=uncultured Winogradskyella sp. TaxID=395353 RepID=UPI0026290166|nr:response regulator transcription factor [uncultured Winogradskyella sp.]